MVHFVAVRSAFCELILNILKRIHKKLCVVCSEIPFGEDSCCIKTSQIYLQLDFLLKIFGANFDMLCFKYCK